MRRILFVDDDVVVLSALESALRRDKNGWQVAFVDNGDKALARLEAEPFHVVVSDMRMPRMDGSTLLKQIQVRHPNVIRILLAGGDEFETALRTVSIAHQFLRKPCDVPTLKNVIERACGLQALLGNSTIRSAIGSVGGLPSVPRVYLAVTRALEDPRAGLKDISKLVEQDMALSAKVLSLVNSAFFGLSQRVTNIAQALSYLGATMIKRVLLSLETFSVFERHRVPTGFSLEDLQLHSTKVATLAAKLTGDPQRAQDAFMAGMLHDVGKLVFATQIPDYVKRATARTAPLHVIEKDLYGVTHAEVGAYLLGLWGLPFPIVEAVAHHHAPHRVHHREFEALDAVHVAESLVGELSKGGHDRMTEARLDLAYLDSLGVSAKLPAWRETASELSAKNP